MTRSIGNLRPSQIITTFGPGSIVDLPKMSVILAGTDRWATTERQRIEEPRLQRALRVDALYAPPATAAEFGSLPTIPSFLFPRYLHCRKCHKLAPASEFSWRWDSLDYRCHNPKCESQGKVSVVPARFVVACIHGHLDDFPWHDFVHNGSAGSCRERLRLRQRGKSGSISDIQVECYGDSRAFRSLGDAYHGGAKAGILGSCSARRPWLGPDNFDPSGCQLNVRPMLRGASNLYFSEIRSVLSIPTRTDRIEDVIARHLTLMAGVQSVDDVAGLLKFANIPELSRWSHTEIWAALQRLRGETEIGRADLLYPEWEAFRHPVPAADRSEFEVHEVKVPSGFDQHLQRVVLAHRLREVRALTAFSRIDPLGELEVPSPPIQVRRAPISTQDLGWLPAVIIRGEGIFVELREGSVREWEMRSPVAQAAQAMKAAYDQWRADRDLPAGIFPGARYVLLHTLAHVLIRELSLDCGYSASSLRERIYSSTTGLPMAGLLIYTATPDSEGSLGGLVDVGQSERLGRTISEALTRAGLCAGDPLCGDTAPGEKGGINGAACHACTLASETSCEHANRFLDRSFLVKTVRELGAEFFAS